MRPLSNTNLFRALRPQDLPTLHQRPARLHEVVDDYDVRARDVLGALHHLDDTLVPLSPLAANDVLELGNLGVKALVRALVGKGDDHLLWPVLAVHFLEAVPKQEHARL